MADPRIERLADVLLRYSTQVKKGERLIIRAGPQSSPLVLALVRKTLQLGAFPLTRISLPGESYLYYRHASDAHLRDLPKISMFEVRNCQASIAIKDDTNTRELSSIDPKRIALRRKTLKPLSDYQLRHVRWCLTLFPTEASAQEAEMSLQEYEDFVYRAMFCDKPDPIAAWNRLGAQQKLLGDRLNRAKEVRIIGKETDLRMSVRGRVFVSSDGTHNMPSGEVFTAPVERSVEGTILYDDFPTIYGGREVSGVFLRFKKGKVVEASAQKNERYLLQMLDIDRGARYLGELGIGTNFGIQRFTKNILFDEKIGGTVHLALGRAYEECRGTNRSALHWDMIKDLRGKGSSVLVDGRPLVRRGDRLVVG